MTEIDKCESPIERKFFAAWKNRVTTKPFSEWAVFANIGPDAFLETAPLIAYNYWIHHCGADYLFVQPQIDEFRVDFAVGRAAVNRDCSTDKLMRLPMIVVECDGHEFHERTKEQAARDKARDSTLQIRGFRVLRFTGTQIARDAAGCVESVYRLFAQIEREMLSVIEEPEAAEGSEITYDQFAKLYADWHNRRVGDSAVGPYRISTVWLGINRWSKSTSVSSHLERVRLNHELRRTDFNVE